MAELTVMQAMSESMADVTVTETMAQAPVRLFANRRGEVGGDTRVDATHCVALRLIQQSPGQRAAQRPLPVWAHSLKFHAGGRLRQQVR